MGETTARNQAEENKICHVINFSVGNTDEIDAYTTRLTIRVRSRWFHIQTCLEDFSASEALSEEYKQLIDAANEQQSDENENANGDDAQGEEAEEPCRKKRKTSAQDSEKDSGYASSEGSEQETPANVHSTKDGEEQTQTDAEQELQNWILAPFGSTFAELAPENTSRKETSLLEWYKSDIHFFRVIATSEDDLEPNSVDGKEDQAEVEKLLMPSMSLPKYLRNLSGVPWVSPSDIQVLSESDDPCPVHPTVVRIRKSGSFESTTHFLKMVAPEQEPAIKRELRILDKISKLGLHEKGLRAPKLEGLVSSVQHPQSQAQILGFLISAIPSPEPLTHFLEASVPQQRRDKWAKESQQLVKILHEHGLVWGDAKADNFVVDKKENLWIIDFGGSYTEGWVDPELMETVEGDDMGINKIEEALKDPGENTYDPTGEEDQENVEPFGRPGVEEALLKQKELGDGEIRNKKRKLENSEPKGEEN